MLTWKYVKYVNKNSAMVIKDFNVFIFQVNNGEKLSINIKYVCNFIQSKDCLEPFRLQI